MWMEQGRIWPLGIIEFFVDLETKVKTHKDLVQVWSHK